MRRFIRRITRNPTFAALVSVIVAFLIGGGGAAGYYMAVNKYENADVHDNTFNITSTVNYMVDTGLVKGDVLEITDPVEQIEQIAAEMSEQQQSYQDTIRSLQEQNKILETEIAKLRQQRAVTLSSPAVSVQGEDIATTQKDYMAVVDGHNYYEDTFLNTFLPEQIFYQDNRISYGSGHLEKVNIVSAQLYYDNFEYDVYNGDAHFTMSRKDYNNGLVYHSFEDKTISIACNGEYANLSFTVGHIDESALADKTLSVMYLDANEEYKECFSLKMTRDMPVKDYIVPIYNTQTVKIKVLADGDYQDTKYGLADICLVR